MQIRTSTCSRRKHPELCLTFDPELAAPKDVQRLRAFFEVSVSKGAKFRPQRTFQIGWMTTFFIERPDGSLGVAEPDFASLPPTWIESVTATVRHLRRQRDVSASLGFADEEEFPSIQDWALIGTDMPEGCGELVLSRSAPSERNSGWFIGWRGSQLDYGEESNRRECSLYEVGMLLPAAVPFLALPEGFEITLHGGAAQYKRFGEEMTPSPDAVVDQWEP